MRVWFRHSAIKIYSHSAQLIRLGSHLYPCPAERTLDDIGLSMSTAINIFLRAVVRENRIPFELRADPFYSRENVAELERRVADVRAGKSVLKQHELIEAE